MSFPKYANSGGWELVARCGIILASHQFQILIFQIKF